MNFQTAISVCFSKYATFEGRAVRSEYWWWTLFIFLGNIVFSIVDAIGGIVDFGLFSTIFSLATLIPSIAVGARRLHDVDKSGWWQLLVLIPLIGWIILLIWVIREGSSEANRFGPAQAWAEDQD